MKKIIKSSILALTLVFFASCENDTDPVAVPGSGFKLLSPDSATAYTLDPENADATTMATFVWEQSENGVQSAADYTLEMATAGTNFANPITVATTPNRYLALNTELINVKLISTPTDGGLGLTPYTEANVDFRIKSALGTSSNAVVQYSNVVTLKITPYSTDLPKIGVAGNHQGWDPPTAPSLASSGFGETNYEGYVWLDGQFKFVAPENGVFSWTTNWGDDASFSGTLVAGSSTNCEAVAGYYRITADTQALTYNTQLVSWGIIGAATPGGWGSDTDMTYDPASGTWKVTIALTAGEFKFRYNDNWDGNGLQWNLGGFDATKINNDYAGEQMSYGGSNLSVATTGTYVVELDLRNPRAYSYTATLQ